MRSYGLAGLLVCAATACGVVGPPVAPEDVGVALTIEKQKKRDEMEAAKRDAAAAEADQAAPPDPLLQGQDENLPPLRPVGSR